MQKLRSVQVLRAIAACAVVLMHASGAEYRPSPLRLGGAGVDLFFVISGFIIATVAVGRTPAQFLVDRLWRVYPLWLVAVLPWLWVFHPDWQTVATSLTLWPIFGAYHSPALAVGWTLSFEMLFYAAMTLAIASRPALPLALFVVAAITAGLWAGRIASYVGSPMIVEFLLGVAISRLPRYVHLSLPLLAAAAAWLALAPAAGFAAADAFMPYSSAVRVAWWGVPAAMIFYAALSAEPLFARAWLNPIVLLGNASYSIYLFHILIGRIIDFDWITETLVMIGGGVLIHLVIERRLMKLRPRLRNSRRPSGKLVHAGAVTP